MVRLGSALVGTHGFGRALGSAATRKRTPLTRLDDWIHFDERKKTNMSLTKGRRRRNTPKTKTNAPKDEEHHATTANADAIIDAAEEEHRRLF